MNEAREMPGGADYRTALQEAFNHVEVTCWGFDALHETAALGPVDVGRVYSFAASVDTHLHQLTKRHEELRRHLRGLDARRIDQARHAGASREEIEDA